MFIIDHESQEVHKIEKHTFAFSQDFYRFLWVRRYNIIIPIQKQDLNLLENKTSNEYII